ncbi:MAG: alpha/beta fold hydrolase [Caulobacteraceae bacterium]
MDSRYLAASPAADAGPAALPTTSSSLTYRTVAIDGLTIFYRQAGPDDAPTLLLLHGYPSSSRMFETLMPLLADRYRLIAPDYPGFGQSDAPPADRFAYTFDHLAEVVGKFTEAIGLESYVLYLQDYGGPIGFRLALVHPERVRGFIVQNAVASEDGLGPAWDIRKAYWRDRAAYEAQVIPPFTSLEEARTRHVGASPHLQRYNPDAWLDEYALLSRPGQQAIQADLFWSYQTNVAAYPKWQAWLRQRQPPMLVVWGRYDPSFAVAGAAAYKTAVPAAEVHILDAGHFALDEKLDEIASLIRDFLSRRLAPEEMVMAAEPPADPPRTHQPDEDRFHAIHAKDIEWRPFAAYPPAARLAILVGDPAKPGPYVIRVKLPEGTKMMPHKHPEDRVYTVMSGVFYIGLGEVFDESKLTAFAPGSVIVLPGGQAHFHWARSGEYITQVTAVGPLGLAYLDPANDPRTRDETPLLL